MPEMPINCPWVMLPISLWTCCCLLVILLAQCCTKKKKKKNAAKDKKKQQTNKMEEPSKVTAPPAVATPIADSPVAPSPIADSQDSASPFDSPVTSTAEAVAATPVPDSPATAKAVVSARAKTKEEETYDSFSEFKVPKEKSRPSAEDDDYKTLVAVFGKDFYKTQRTQSTMTKSTTTTTGMAELEPTSDGQSSAMKNEPAQKFMTSSDQRRESQVNAD